MVSIGSGTHVVSQGAGYGIIIGLSVLFCIIILFAIKIQKRYLMEDSDKSEMFMVANRTVGRGLTASAVFSSWMWITETVFAVMICYEYGLAAPMLYGVGLSFQISLMAVIGVVSKIRAPHAHTSLEIVRRRYGNIVHLVFTVLNLINNIFGCSSMILAGSQLITGITDVHIVAATILLPFGVVAYTAVGGLKATFLTDYLHTTIALILIIYFTLSVLTSEHIGGVGGLYDKIQAGTAAGKFYVPGNYAGSLLTFKSTSSMIFATTLKLGNLALITMDTAFWQKSFASEVTATVPGYDMAAISIFAVPWGIGTVLGLSTRILETLPIFPTYPKHMTASDIGTGFPMVYTIQAILGPKGVIAFMLLLFMAMTSTVSSSMIAVSSVFSFDIYRTYINPRAKDHQIVRISHLGVVLYGVFICGFTLALTYGGANILWWNYFAPTIICPGIFPLLLTLFWKRQTRLAAMIAPILGMVTGISIWVAVVKVTYGTINMTTTSTQRPALYGALGSTFSPIIYSVVISYIRPSVFDWREFLRIELVEDESESTTPAESVFPAETSFDEKKGAETDTTVVPLPEDQQTVDLEYRPTSGPLQTSSTSLDDISHPWDDDTLKHLYRWLKIAIAIFITIVLVMWVLWPMPLWRNYIFTKSFFSGWVVVSIMFQFLAFFLVVVYPVWDGRYELAKAFFGVKKSLFDKKTV